MTGENISPKFRLKKIETVKNVFIKERDQNELTREKYIEHFLILAFAITQNGISSSFASLCGTPVRITSSARRLKFFAMIAAIKNNKSKIQKERKKRDMIILPARTKLSSIEVLIPKALNDSHINHDEFV